MLWMPLLEGDEMVFLRHGNRLYQGRISQMTGVDASDLDFSDVRNVAMVEMQDDLEAG
jgi:hypothetical protein